MQYIVTWSYEDQSFVGWVITEDLELKFDKLINSEELDYIIGLEDVGDLVGVSNCIQIILEIYRDDPYSFEIIDITTKSRQELNVQGLKESFDEDEDSATFLENEDLVIVKKYPACRAYIFSKFNGKPQWTCENFIKDFDKSFIFKNRKLLLVFEIPFVIMQWNLKTLEFEMQYILNWNLKSGAVVAHNTKDFLYIYSPKYENYEEYKIISDFIIKQDINYLSIQRLLHNEYWKSYLQVQKCHNYSNEPKKLSYGESYTWIINTSLDTLDRIGLEDCHYTTLQAIIGKESTNETDFTYYDKEDSYILENKLFENGDFIFAYLDGIQIYAINAKKKALYLIDKSNFKYLPPPTYVFIDYYINNRLAVKLYGKEKFYQLAQYESKEKIKQLFDKCFEYGFSIFKSGDICDFMLFTSQIVLVLIKLEEFNKNLKVTETKRFLTKINLLIPKNYNKAM
ncbi:hypothetical protein C2G38_2219030 [Gigaspora rosea]|uniref:Uncharacterized protein n=1 Tax=Gigaspora rosea TaxID=44941 RepID=A0A397UAA9_9GLOM|nr:hypothetical protein C2G38_2219030 [Gigaspora rosea]